MNNHNEVQVKLIRVKACDDVFIICNLSIPHLFFVLFFFRKFAVEFIVTSLLLRYFLSVKSQSAKQDYFNNLVFFIGFLNKITS